ncbi:MAG: sensor histidine kinase [Bacteroidia bacterium]|nr:sensor histidine kinase [Bacteroidia bacterium]
MKNKKKYWPDFFKKIPSEYQSAFFNILEISLKKDLNLTSKEERKFKKEITTKLEILNIPESSTLADILIDIGIYDIKEDINTILLATNCKEILMMIYKLSGLFHSSQTIQTATDRASKMVFALKNFAHFDSTGEQVKANIIDGIETVLTLYHNILKHGIEVIKNYTEVPAIYCFPDELNQVWTNIIHNAVQAMENKGTLTIDINGFEEKNICVSFTDTGCGIPIEIKDKIFEPFFTTKRQGEGSGLGLDIVKKIIDRHKGKIEVESEPGNTTFSIYLPLTS